MDLRCPCGEANFIKRGYYKPRSNNYQPIPRYQCRSCRKTFSRQTNAPTHRQKKPALNSQILQWYCSGTTQRRMAKVMGVNRKTIIRKFVFMARLARTEHERITKAGGIKTSFVQFDEMETFEHTKLKPLSIAIAVRAKTGEIIEAQVATMNCHGNTAKISQAKYGWRQDTRSAACEDVLRQVNSCSRDNVTIVSDGKPVYWTWVKKFVPHAEFSVVDRGDKNGIKADSRKNKKDGLFTLNYTAAKLRNDLSRLTRKTWVTTKAAWALQAHLDLYIAFNNGYKLGV